MFCRLCCSLSLISTWPQPVGVYVFQPVLLFIIGKHLSQCGARHVLLSVLLCVPGDLLFPQHHVFTATCSSIADALQHMMTCHPAHSGRSLMHRMVTGCVKMFQLHCPADTPILNACDAAVCFLSAMRFNQDKLQLLLSSSAVSKTIYC